MPFRLARLIDVVQAQRVDLVQGLEFAVGIPPFVGEGAEFVEFQLVGVAHGFLFQCVIRDCQTLAVSLSSRSSRLVSWRLSRRNSPSNPDVADLLAPGSVNQGGNRVEAGLGLDAG